MSISPRLQNALDRKIQSIIDTLPDADFDADGAVRAEALRRISDQMWEQLTDEEQQEVMMDGVHALLEEMVEDGEAMKVVDIASGETRYGRRLPM